MKIPNAEDFAYLGDYFAAMEEYEYRTYLAECLGVDRDVVADIKIANVLATIEPHFTTGSSLRVRERADEIARKHKRAKMAKFRGSGESIEVLNEDTLEYEPSSEQEINAYMSNL